MAEFETAEESNVSSDERASLGERSRYLWEKGLKRVVLFISFGPGVLGFLWLIGRILRR